MLPWVSLGLLALVTAVGTGQLWLLPSLLFKEVRLGLAPEVLDWEDAPPSQEDSAWFDQVVPGLEALGFQAGRRTRVAGELATSVVWRTHLRHTKNRTRAAISAWHLERPEGLKAIRREVTLQVEADRGQILVATTSVDVDDALWPSGLVSLVLPEEQDMGVLLACFEQRLEELGPDLGRSRRNRRDGPAEVAFRRQELLEHQAELGLVRLNEPAGVWRLTWTGACMNAFYQFWPLRRRTLRRQVRELARLKSLV